jgi:hypothetical protein
MHTRKVSKTGRAVLSVLAALGAIHFMIGFRLMIPLIWWMGRPWLDHAIFCLPYAGLLLLFLASFGLALRARLRWSAIVLIVALACSAGLCAYDLTHGRRAQILGGGVGHTYLFWWWYYEPYWYNYERGNI